MGIMDVFKKKNAEPEFSADNLGLSSAPMTPDMTGLPPANIEPSPSYNEHQSNMSMSSMMNNNTQYQQPIQQSQQPDLSRDLQMISLKLDAIKSELDAMNQRIKNVEAIAEKEQAAQGQQKKWY